MLQAKAARVCLEFIKVLPEECCNNRVLVPEANRESFLQQLSNSSDQLLKLLGDLATGPLASSPMIMETVFEALQIWIRHTDIDAAKLGAHPLLPMAFDALSSPALFESAVDLLVEVLRVSCHYVAWIMSIVQVMVSRCMGLKGMYQWAVEEEDEDCARGLCRLFTELGESYMDLIMWEQELGQVSFVELILLCTSHPAHEIATIPLHFWYTFTRALERLRPPELHKAKLEAFGATLNNLIGVLILLMRYPEEFDAIPSDQVDDLKRHRYDVSDVLNDCCRVLGGASCAWPLTSHLSTDLLCNTELSPLSWHNQTSENSWQMVEACLFGIRSIAKSIPADENVVMHNIMTLLRQLPPTCNSHIRYTANLIVGRYSGWLQAHPDLLQPMFTFLLQGFGTPESASAAATSIKNVCESCAGQMGEPALSLHDQLRQSKEWLQFRDELEILEGICHIISTLPVASATSALQKVVEPIAHELATQCNSQGGGDRKEVGQHLDRLANIVRRVKPALAQGEAHPVVGIVQQLWPLLEATHNLHQSNVHIVEKLCRIHKHSMRATRNLYEPLLEPLLKLLVEHFRVKPHSTYLYCASIAITEFGRFDRFVPILYHMFDVFCSEVFAHLQSPEHFTNEPDMVEEFFYLAGRFVSYCPQSLVSSPLLRQVVAFAIAGLRQDHREARKAVLQCLDDVLYSGFPDRKDIGNDTGSGGENVVNYAVVDGSAADRRAKIEEMMRADQGQSLVRGLIRCTVGQLPSYALDERGSAGSVASVIWRLFRLWPKLLQEWLMVSLNEVPTSTASSDQKEQFMRSLFREGITRDEGIDAVRHFSHLCRQNTRRWNAQ
ncbi:unnamed protein product [Chrysoparadoxa australica]